MGAHPSLLQSLLSLGWFSLICFFLTCSRTCACWGHACLHQTLPRSLAAACAHIPPCCLTAGRFGSPPCLALLPLADSFRKDVLAIIEAVPPKRQLLALSATYAPAALQQLRGLMGGRQQEVLLCCEDTSLLAVRQCYRMLPPSGAADEATAAGQASSAQHAAAAEEGSFGPHFEARLAALLNLLSSVSFQQAVVFCKYKTGAAARC